MTHTSSNILSRCSFEPITTNVLGSMLPRRVFTSIDCSTLVIDCTSCTLLRHSCVTVPILHYLLYSTTIKCGSTVQTISLIWLSHCTLRLQHLIMKQQSTVGTSCIFHFRLKWMQSEGSAGISNFSPVTIHRNCSMSAVSPTTPIITRFWKCCRSANRSQLTVCYSAWKIIFWKSSVGPPSVFYYNFLYSTTGLHVELGLAQPTLSFFQVLYGIELFESVHLLFVVLHVVLRQ